MDSIPLWKTYLRIFPVKSDEPREYASHPSLHHPSTIQSTGMRYWWIGWKWQEIELYKITYITSIRICTDTTPTWLVRIVLRIQKSDWDILKVEVLCAQHKQEERGTRIRVGLIVQLGPLYLVHIFPKYRFTICYVIMKGRPYSALNSLNFPSIHPNIPHTLLLLLFRAKCCILYPSSCVSWVGCSFQMCTGGLHF